jgi:hypothetical protein
MMETCESSTFGGVVLYEYVLLVRKDLYMSNTCIVS